jgi:hypothetical protein
MLTRNIQPSFFKKSVLALIFFLVTLQSYYFYEIGLAPFPILAFIGILLFPNNRNSPVIIVNISYFLGVLFVISSIWGFFFQLDFFYINSIIGILFGPFIIIHFVKFLIGRDINLIHNILAIVLFTHLVCFLIQFASYMLFGINIDYLQFVTGEASRYEAYGAITGLIRPTGVFNEPATYSYYVFILVYLRFLCFNKINGFDQLALITMLFTLSLSGFFLYSFFQFYYWILYKGNFKSIILFSVLISIFLYVVIVVFEDSINIYLMSRISDAENDNSMNTRFSDGIVYFMSLPTQYILFGLGIGNYTRYISTSASGWMAILTTFGLIPGVSFFAIIGKYFNYLNVKFVTIIPLFILLFSTITPMQVIFWVILSFFVCQKYNHQIYA